MELSKVINERRSIRKYKPDSIPKEQLNELYKALQAAPSGSNRQAYKFLFVKDDKKRLEIAEQACHQDFIKEPPVIMVATCDQGRSFNVAIAVDHMILKAKDLGLGTCWVGWFDKDKIRKILDIPEDKEIPIIVPIGYPDHSPEKRERKPLSELIEEI